MKGFCYIASAAAVVGLAQGRPQVETVGTPTGSKISGTSTATDSPGNSSIPACVVAVPTSTGSPTGITPGPSAIATNPYSAACPVPSNFIINSFAYANGPPPLDTHATTLQVKYGDLDLTCPTRPDAWSLRYGLLSLQCDDAGLVTAIVPNGRDEVYFVVNLWCPAVPQPATGQSTLNLRTEPYSLDSFMSCEYPYPQEQAIKTCSQSTPDFVIPAANFYTGNSSLTFTPIAINGSKISTCPSVPNVNPILEDPDKCVHFGGDNSSWVTKRRFKKRGELW